MKTILGALGVSFLIGALWGYAVGRGYPIPDTIRAFFLESLWVILAALIIGLIVSGAWWFLEATGTTELKEELTKNKERLQREWERLEGERRRFEKELDHIREEVRRKAQEEAHRQILHYLRKAAERQEQIYKDSIRTAEEEIRRLQGEVRRLKHEIKACNDRIHSYKSRLTNHVLTLIPGVDQALLLKALKRRKDIKTIRDRLRKI